VTSIWARVSVKSPNAPSPEIVLHVDGREVSLTGDFGGSFPGEAGLVSENNSVCEFPAATPNQSLDKGMTPRCATDRFYFLDLVVLG
jgi:hypothetical protein